MVRLVYRQPLSSTAWWAPTQLQYGVGAWRVPDLRGRTRRYEGESSVGLALQHLSNAGLKQPNGGIDLYLVTATFRL